MFFKTANGMRQAPLKFNPFNALVSPRPIGWISSISKVGNVNLAPFSYFNALSSDPPMVMFSVNANPNVSGHKDSLANVLNVPEFVANIVSQDLMMDMVGTSGAFPHGVNEMTEMGLEAAASSLVRPPRVAKAPAALECQVWKTIDLPQGDDGRASTMVLGSVIGMYIQDDLIVDGKVDVTKFNPVSRLGYRDYSIIKELIDVTRPS